jgi:spore coat protein U-like protein
MKKLLLTILILTNGSLFLFPHSCFAPTATSSFVTSATVTSVCTFTVANLTFPNTYNPTTGTNNTANTTFTTMCTNGADYHLNFNAGVNSGGASNYNTQRMNNGGIFVTYNLYIDSGYANLWGDGTNGSVSYSSATAYTGNPSTTGTGAARNLTVYGRITPGAQPTAGPGTYTDTVTASLTIP